MIEVTKDMGGTITNAYMVRLICLVISDNMTSCMFVYNILIGRKTALKLFHMQLSCAQDPLSDYESDFYPTLSFAKTTGWKKSE